MNLSAIPALGSWLSGLINPKGNWPEPLARLHSSLPDNRHITALTPESVSAAAWPGDKILFLRRGKKKSWEGRSLVF